MATATLIARHQVDDYAAWRSVFEEVEGLRQEYGCTSKQVMTNPDDKNDVFILHTFPTLEQAQGFATSDALREAMGRAGVQGAPRIEIAVEA